jgi:hypothetical protein
MIINRDSVDEGNDWDKNLTEAIKYFKMPVDFRKSNGMFYSEFSFSNR